MVSRSRGQSAPYESGSVSRAACTTCGCGRERSSGADGACNLGKSEFEIVRSRGLDSLYLKLNLRKLSQTHEICGQRKQPTLVWVMM